MRDILLAVPDVDQEPELVTGAAAAGLRVLRRCVDAVDLVASAAVDPGTAAVVSAGLPRLSAEVVERLAAGSRPVVGLAADPSSAERLHQLGVAAVVAAGPSAAASLRAVGAVLAGAGPATPAGGVWPTGCWSSAPAADPAPQSSVDGAVVAVWGPMGAPGRTTVAIGVAEALARSGHRVCLADADTYAPAVALALAVVDDGGGLVAACRHADHGSLDASTLASASREIRRDLHLLGGLRPADGWADLRAGALDRVWQGCRAGFDVTVVDVGFCLEDDDAPGAWARRRNGAALTAIAAADHVLAVADASGLGAARLCAAWGRLREVAAHLPVTVVRNRSPRAARGWDAAVRAGGVAAPVCGVPVDHRALAACWGRGLSLGEGARRSRLRPALAAVADAVLGG